MIDTLYLIIKIICILAILSLLIKDNPLYRIVEHIAIGGGVAHLLIFGVDSMISSGLKPAFEGRILLIIPVVLSVLSLARLTQFKWVSRYSYAVLVGVGVGLMLATTIQGQIINNIKVIGDMVLGSTNILELSSGVLASIGLISGMTYFIYTREHTGLLGRSARLGRFFLMVAFGIQWSMEVSWFLGSFSGQIEKVITGAMTLLGM